LTIKKFHLQKWTDAKKLY